MDVSIRSISLEDVESFRECVDVVAREKIYIAVFEAYPLEVMRSFFAANGRGLTRIELEVRVDNERAARAYRRAGFQVEGRKLRRMQVDGQYFDTFLPDGQAVASLNTHARNQLVESQGPLKPAACDGDLISALSRRASALLVEEAT